MTVPNSGSVLHSYLTLLLAGFALPFDVTMNAVSSYPTFSTLTWKNTRIEMLAQAVCSLVALPSALPQVTIARWVLTLSGSSGR